MEKDMNEKKKLVKDLKPGDMVVAIRLLDPDAAHVTPDTIGVVFGETDYFKDGCGPIVRWLTGATCNVYEGDVEFIECPHVIKLEVGKSDLINGYQETKAIGKNNEGNTIAVNCHYDESDNLVYVYIETFTPEEMKKMKGE